jgi:hypothetical protein
VQNLSVANGSKALVSNVAQHANVIVFGHNPATAAHHALEAAGATRRRDGTDAERDAPP